MTETHETELELAGEMRPCVVDYLVDDGVVDIVMVTIGFTTRLNYTRDGEYCPHDVTHTENVTKLLSSAQIKGLAAEIREAIEETA